MNNNRPNPKMITLGREIRGMTQAKLAEATIGISQGNLSRMEKGMLSISENALEEISRILRFPLSFFYLKEARTPISDFYYRQRISIPKKELAQNEALIDLIRLSIDHLSISVELPPFSLPIFESDLKLSPEEIARKLRSFLRLPKGPVHNIVQLLERNGVVVFELDSSPEKFDGITLLTDSGIPIIFVNSNHSNDRKRFTIIHEMGHLVMHIFNTNDTKSSDEKENEANRFTAEFAMPELDCRNDLAGLTFSNLIALKKHWMMSMRAIIYRANQLSMISPAKAQNLYIELSRLGYVKKEPIVVEFGKPRILNEIINIFQNQLEYSNEELSSYLSIHPEDFQTYFLKERIASKLRVVV